MSLLSSNARSILFRRCMRPGYNAGSRVEFPSATPRYVSTATDSNKIHGAGREEVDHVDGGRNGGVSSIALLILASIASGATFYYVGSRTSKSPVSTSKQGPGLPTSTSSTLPIAKVQAPEHDISPANMSAAYKEFVAVIGNENVSTAKDSLESHTSTEWSSYPAIPSQYPQYVLFPASTEEVSKIMKICHTRRIPVVAFSGGTSLEGHFANTRHGIALDFTRMNSIITVHKDDLDAVVQPGVRYDELNEVLEKDNLFFPPDPGPGAMIGGMIGTGCSGTNAYHYGTMREWVINVTAVMADGTIVKTRQRPRKSSAGYDLTKIFIGSEGTLGLITEATVKVTNKPQHENVAVVSFSTVRSAAECVSDFVKSGIQVAAVELLDETAMRLINEGGSLDRDWQETPTLFIKFNGTTAGVAEQIQIVQGVAKDHGSTGFVFAKDKEEAEDLWTCRKTALWGAAGIKKHDSDHPWITDVAVPISKLPDIIEDSKKALGETGLVGAMVGHVGDGNFHWVLFFANDERSVAETFVHNLVNRAIELEGTVTGEHGVGLVKRDYLSHEVGETTVDLMRKMKLAFDPLCLLNCDKVIRVVPE